MENNDFSFLSERITESNNETEFFLVDMDTTFVKIPEGEDLQRDQLLLNFTQRIWEVPSTSNTDILTPYYSKYFNKNKCLDSFHIHDITYRDFVENKLELETSISCKPTLSFRTLIYDDSTHIKFGLPIFYGSIIRRNTKKEVLTSLYLSDYIRSLPKIDKLDFFLEFKGYSIQGIEDYSVSYRKKEYTEETMPFSCYFNKILHHSNGTPADRFEETLAFLSCFFSNFNEVYKALKNAGLGLEIHGQNLLVKLDSEGSFSHEYVYRDLGTCTLDPIVQKKQIDLNDYYKSNYNYDFAEGQLIHSGYYAWMNYRNFFLSFLLFNLNKFADEEGIKTNVYEWFENATEDLHEINSIF